MAGGPGVLRTLLPAGHLPPCWHPSCALHVAAVPLAGHGGSLRLHPSSPQTPGKLLRPRLHLRAPPRPLPAACAFGSGARVGRANAASAVGQPQHLAGLFIPIVPAVFRVEQSPASPPLPAALGFACRAGEQRMARLSPLPATAVPSAPLPCSQQGFLPRVRQSLVAGRPAQPSSLAVTSSSHCSMVAMIQLHRRTCTGRGSPPVPPGSPPLSLGGASGGSHAWYGTLSPGPWRHADAVGVARLAVTPGPPPQGPWHL